MGTWFGILCVVIVVFGVYVLINNFMTSSNLSDYLKSKTTDDDMIHQKYFGASILNKVNGNLTIYKHIGFVENIGSGDYSVYKTNVKNILNIELIEDNNQLISTNRMSQLVGGAVGGALLGGVGAIIGGVTAKKSISQKCKLIKIAITFDDINHMRSEIIFLQDKDGYSKDGSIYELCMKEAITWFDALTILMKKEDIVKCEPTNESIHI